MAALLSSNVLFCQLKTMEYLIEENRILRNQLDKRVKLTNEERVVLVEKGKALGRLLTDTITIVKPETLLKWHRELIAKKFDSSGKRKKVGRPRIDLEIEKKVIELAKENPCWGYDRIMGAIEVLGYDVSDQTVGNVLKRNGFSPSGERKRKSTWHSFIKQHKDVIWATDCFSTEVWTKGGLVSFYILFFINLKTRKVILGGINTNPDGDWTTQVARNFTGYDDDMYNAQFLIRDRDSKFTESFDNMFKSIGCKIIKLPFRSPYLNAFAERWGRSIKYECLNNMILFGEKQLRYVIRNYIDHYNSERTHQGINNQIPIPDERSKTK